MIDCCWGGGQYSRSIYIWICTYKDAYVGIPRSQRSALTPEVWCRALSTGPSLTGGSSGIGEFHGYIIPKEQNSSVPTNPRPQTA